MSKPDELLVEVAALVESGQSNQMSLTVVTGGAVITGRLAPEAVWRQRVSEVLTDTRRGPGRAGADREAGATAEVRRKASRQRPRFLKRG
ncbi:hypothetical protein [Streptomyces peucetius]|uniref:hypothetical protein n=1 Tax=Streptomyces peucetius TaxID=1950 RepID=UPI00131B5497|nr:hypothetical protein [Streptomyces peucetius]